MSHISLPNLSTTAFDLTRCVIFSSLGARFATVCDIHYKSGNEDDGDEPETTKMIFFIDSL